MGKVKIKNKNRKVLPYFLQGQTSSLATALSWLVASILVALPFHAFLTVWLSSLTGHYTLLRLWKEFLLLIILAGAAYILIKNKKLRARFLESWLVRLIGVYTLVMLLWGFVALARHDVSGKAMWYGLLVNLRFLLIFLVAWVVAAKSSWLGSNWQKILFAPAILVAALAILQFLVLPYDFLKHFGYGPSTISPYETINHNINHLRVASTLRGANPLGAYLVLPISALAVAYFNKRGKVSDKLMLGFGLLLALTFSFSRSAWVGCILSLMVIVWVKLKNPQANRRMLQYSVILVVIVSALVIGLRHNATFENIFFHTDHTSRIAESSNEGHSAAFRNAVKDIIHHPLGSGVGTAGPESIYNNHPPRIAENYFLQIGQEAGIIGMALFMAISVAIAKLLWGRRSDPLALWLFASLIGLSLINLLSHAWTDDTLAYIWWGLAGVALAPKLYNQTRQTKSN